MAVSPAPHHPPALQPGDRVRVVAPSSPFSRDDFDAGVAVLREWGLDPVWRDDVFERRHYLAGTPRRRAEELHEAFEDPTCKAIWAVRGGYGVGTVLPLLDAARIAKNPTIFVGCSDLTLLLNWLVQTCGVPAIHGPMVASVGRRQDPAGAARVRSILAGDKPAELRSALPDARGWCVSPGTARGVAVGGSLSLLAAACGTPEQVDTEGAVLFLEDVGERPYRVDRLLLQLDRAGLLDAASALVLGDFAGCEEPGLTWRDAVDRVVRGKPLPVLAGVPFGHGNPNLAVPLGGRVQLDAGAGWVRFRDKPVR